jgi:hypothetical protein
MSLEEGKTADVVLRVGTADGKGRTVVSDEDHHRGIVVDGETVEIAPVVGDLQAAKGEEAVRVRMIQLMWVKYIKVKSPRSLTLVTLSLSNKIAERKVLSTSLRSVNLDSG